MVEKLTHIVPRKGYDLWAPHYDEYDNPLIALEEPILAELMDPVAGLRIADIGCGTGRYTLPLAEAGGIVTGVDFSTRMLDVLRSKHLPSSINVIEHDLTKGLPLESGVFDLAISCLVIEHLPNINRVFKELARICKAGGKVIVSDFHPEMIRRGYHARFRKASGGQKYQIEGMHRSVSEYVMAALNAGLQIQHISEHIVDQALVRRTQSAKQWLGQPLLLVLKLIKSNSSFTL
ncbi:MAG: class I SAM-dependent methyltransferase [Myxococcota bacterium]|nr:class I SAM-dependent methyltransferase [Myxococcota bacterium]